MSPAVLELDALAWLITFSPCMSLSPAVHDPRTEVGMLLDTRLSTQSILLHDYQLNRMLLVTLKSRVHSSHDLALTLPSSRTVTPVSYFGIFVQVLQTDVRFVPAKLIPGVARFGELIHCLIGRV